MKFAAPKPSVTATSTSCAQREQRSNLDLTPGKPVRLYARDGQWRDLSTDELVGQKANAFKGWKCGAGVENLQINMDGDIFAATCKVGGFFGNIYDENRKDFSSPPSWQTCTFDYCSCGADLFIPKVKVDSARPLLRRTLGLHSQDQRAEINMQDVVATERTHFSNYKQVYWEIGRRCNFDCSYCAPYIHNKTDPHRSLEELKQATQYLLQRFAPGSLVNFIISGGEPTLNPAFLPWARWIAEQKHYLSMHSNGSMKTDYYRELITYGDLNLSVHFEFTKLDKMLANIAAIAEEKTHLDGQRRGHLEVKIMMPPGFRNMATDFEAELRKIPHFENYCTWAIVPIRGGGELNQLVDGYDALDIEMFGDRR